MLAALAGGVGAARFLRGLVQVVPADEIVVIVNTGDDDEFHGLYVCPDLDSVTYTLAGAEQPRDRAGASPARRSRRIGRPRPLRRAHLVPPRRPRPRHPPVPHRAPAAGAHALARSPPRSPRAWGLGLALAADDRRPGRHPDHRARPTAGRRAARCRSGSCASGPSRRSSRCASRRRRRRARARRARGARSAPTTIARLPVNPVISIGPILAVPGIRDALGRAPRPGRRREPDHRGRPVKGPADRLMGPLGHRRVVRRRGARSTREFCGTLVIDAGDARRARRGRSARRARAVVADTLMTRRPASRPRSRAHTLAAVA